MDFRIARKAIVGFLKILDLHRKNVAEISFGGGEPLLNWKVIQQVVEYCHKQYSNKFSFHFSINTNGSLITSQIASIIKKYDIEVAPSIDGLESGNDKVRIYKNGKGTFQAINESLNLLRLYEIPIKGVSVTLNEKNFAELNSSFIDWAVKYGMKAVHINIDVVNMVSISTKKVIEKLIHLKQYAQQYGIEISGFWARPTENLNESICFLV